MEKELIILVVYINVDGLSRQGVNEYLFQIELSYKNMYDDTDKNIKTYYLPVNNHQETKIECIYPFNKQISLETEFLKLYKIISESSIKDEYKEEVDNIINEMKIKLNIK